MLTGEGGADFEDGFIVALTCIRTFAAADQITHGIFFFARLSKGFLNYAIEGSARAAGMPKGQPRYLFAFYRVCLPDGDTRRIGER